MFERYNPDSLEYEEVPELLWNLIRSDPDFSKVHFQNMGSYTSVETPAVVWRGLGYKPGNTYAKSGSRESLKMRKVSEIPSRDGRSLIESYCQKHTGEIQFEVIAASSKESYRLLHRLESAIRNAMPGLKSNGVHEFIFTSANPEWTLERGGIQLYVKPSKYTFIWDKRVRIAVPRIMEIGTQNSTLTRAVDIAIVRTSSDFDIIEQTGVSKVDFAFDVPYLSQEPVTSGEELPDAWSPYLEGLDFTCSKIEGTGYTKVTWLPRRHNPQSGTTYYITYWYSQS